MYINKYKISLTSLKYNTNALNSLEVSNCILMSHTFQNNMHLSPLYLNTIKLPNEKIIKILFYSHIQSKIIILPYMQFSILPSTSFKSNTRQPFFPTIHITSSPIFLSLCFPYHTCNHLPHFFIFFPFPSI